MSASESEKPKAKKRRYSRREMIAMWKEGWEWGFKHAQVRAKDPKYKWAKPGSVRHYQCELFFDMQPDE